MSTYVVVEISPETTTSPVFTSVSHATRPLGSSAITASRTPSEIWSAILSGCPSVTDSEVNRNSLSESCGVVIRGEKGTDERAASAPAAAGLEIDHKRHPLELVALPQLVLQEVGVVARDLASVVELDGGPGWARLELGHVVEPQALAPLRRGLALALEVAQEAVQLRGRDPLGRAVG